METNKNNLVDKEKAENLAMNKENTFFVYLLVSLWALGTLFQH